MNEELKMRVLLGLSLAAFSLVFLSSTSAQSAVNEKQTHLQCETLADDNVICLGGGAETTGSVTKDSSASGSKASGLVKADDASGGALDLTNDFEFNTVLGDSTLVPVDTRFSSLHEGQKVQNRVQSVNLLLQAMGPGSAASKVGVAGKKN